VWRAAHELTAWKVTSVEVAGKEGDGLREGKGRDSRRHKVGGMLVRLRTNRAAVGAYRKNHLCINIHFLKFQFEYIY
jgi:hypothetical protein